ncbi:MAG: glucose 1-dehydrogenase [Cytophagales bacterium]|nr:MAG: glucose 1-dehydrogenase [Cytophagales bacterium]
MNANNLFDLTGRVAVVTGASKGIGESIAKLLAQNGAEVIVSSRKQDSVQEVADEIKKQGYKAEAMAAHMGDMASIAQLVQNIGTKYGRLDIIVNNAATNPVFGSVENCSLEAFDKIMEVNVKGCFQLAKEALPLLKKNKNASIINMSSVGGISPEPGLGIYSVSKTALIMLTKVMAKEWGAYGIRANVICPGLIKTKFSEALWKNEQVSDHLLKELPISRIGMPEDIAGLTLFLASDAAAYSTGGVFVADGGMLI